MQALQDIIANYRGIYNDGYEALHTRRLKGLDARGLVPEGVEPAPFYGNEYRKWGEQTDEERVVSSRKMETYAAMVDLIDDNMQRVVEYLESTGKLDNTFVLFMSDNGAEGKAMEALPILGPTPLGEAIKWYYSNSVDNIGIADSFVSYGPGWACAASAPSKGFKAFTFEGGVRCPCMIRYPGLERTRSGAISYEFITCMDILTTMLELAGVKHPHPQFRGREVVPLRGKSWVPYLGSTANAVHEDGTEAMGWELFGRRAISRGDWKGVFIPAPQGSDEWELYNVRDHPGEVHDLAEERENILQGLIVDWGAIRARYCNVWLNSVEGYVFQGIAELFAFAFGPHPPFFSYLALEDLLGPPLQSSIYSECGVYAGG